MRNSSTFLASCLSTVLFLLLIHKDCCEQIIGGTEVTPHSRPYMVLLNTGQSICAGALIKETWVLTAAHCNLNKKTQIILGAHLRSSNEPERQISLPKKIIPYPCYDHATRDGDLQLLQLSRRATLNKNVAILHLPKKGEDVKPGTMCQVAGWGKDSNVSGPSKCLKEVNVTVIDRKVCNNEKHYNYNPVIRLSMICAGNLRGGKDTCNGDSGSPLICEGTFRGITSAGHSNCGTPQGPGIYTLLTQKHLNWIIKTISRAM
ncbi:granzyme A-like [Erinaceus europaeus]|uniref:Granzyme A-like n=1 Tax=Erinaceus europaeus TaxID=9365 RepID=A0A1S2ZGC2_ERIEU|nr:granzyme A-like [Erinaceus europaeus]